MVENQELVEYLRDYKAEKVLRKYRWNIITNWILIAFIVALGVYLVYNIEAFKLIGQDVCKLCAEKTSAVSLP